MVFNQVATEKEVDFQISSFRMIHPESESDDEDE